MRNVGCTPTLADDSLDLKVCGLVCAMEIDLTDGTNIGNKRLFMTDRLLLIH